MNNVSSIKSLKIDSPKTPGGISKSLLTPCRRLGLSRNYKKAGPVPFISPLSGNSSSNVEIKVEKKQPRKRKKSVESEVNEEESEATPIKPIVEDGVLDVDDEDVLKPERTEEDDLTSTPTRHIDIPRKKKSKTLLTALGKSQKDKTALAEKQSDNDLNETSSKVLNNTKLDKEEEGYALKKTKNKNSPKTSKENAILMNDNAVNFESKQEETGDSEIIVIPLQKTRTKSNNKSKKIVEPQKSPKNLNKAQKNITDSTKEHANPEEKTTYSIKPRSPNDLTKECIVVIQKKIFKTDKNSLAKSKGKNSNNKPDSDLDDVPLSELNNEAKINKKESKEPLKPATEENEIINIDEENEDIFETKKKIVKKLEDKATSIKGLKKKTTKIEKPKLKTHKSISVPSTDFDDEDDFDFDNKKTILIRKTYEKISKPQKAKSTGSITQRDIDELKARIEAKKKLLVARTMTEDTEELRTLIKKWQKGCQDALMELMDLMKNKFPDKQNMDYSEMLSMLKIPTHLVGYDEENDCFNTPDDAYIVLSRFNDF